MRRAKCLVILLGVAALISCSGAAGGNPPGGSDGKTLTFYSEPALDGYVRALAGSTYDGSFSGTSVALGNDAAGNTIRCFVSFNLAGLAADAQIQSATLRMYQNAVSAGNSYPETTGLGWILVNNTTYTAASTWADLYNDCTTGTDIGIGPISSSFVANTWHELDVTTSASDEINHYHHGRLQFLLYHHLSSSGRPDNDGWVMGESATNRPELVITLK
jgi:hypothetical protein